MKPTLIMAMVLVFVPSLARAETPEMLPDMLGASWLRYGEGRAKANWEIDAAGKVILVTMVCPDCRNPNPRRREFSTDPVTFARISALFPAGSIDRALRAPCTLPHAVSGWLDRVEIVERRSNVTTHTDTFSECRSPEMDDLFARLKQATAIIMAAEPKPGAQGETE